MTQTWRRKAMPITRETAPAYALLTVNGALFHKWDMEVESKHISGGAKVRVDGDRANLEIKYGGHRVLLEARVLPSDEKEGESASQTK